MGFVKKILYDKKKFAIAAVCLFVMGIAVASAIVGDTFALDSGEVCYQCNSDTSLFEIGTSTSAPSSSNCPAGWHVTDDSNCEGTSVEVSAYFNSNGGSPGTYDSKKCTIPAGGSSCSITVSDMTPTRADYIFKGWGTSSTCTSGNKSSVTIGKATTFFACWVKNETVRWTYNPNGGAITSSWSYKDYTPTSSAIAIITPNASRTGYTLKSWNTEKDGSGTSIKTDGSSYATITSNQTLYAQWTAVKNTITFDANGGTYSGDNSSVTTRTAETGKTVTDLPAPSKSGYTFLGWYTSSGTQFTTSTVVKSSYTVYARWGFTVTFVSNGATHIPYSTQTVYTGGIYGSLPSATKTGYRLVGWYPKNGLTSTTGTDWGDKIETSDEVTKTGAHSLYARWNANTYTVEYNGNGSTSGSTKSSLHSYDVDGNLTDNGFGKTNFDFTGWNTRSDGKGTSYANKASVKNLTSTNEGVVTLYAQWKEKNTSSDGANSGGNTDETGGGTTTSSIYYVKYNSNGGTGTMSNSKHTYGTSSLLTVNTFAKNGYTFSGWNTKPDGSGTSYTNGQSVSNLSSTNNDVVTLYAQWKGLTYTVKYDGNDSTGGSTASSTHTYGVAKTLTTNGYTKTDYTFKGWNTKADGSGTNYTDAQSVKNLTTTAGDTITLYAQWKSNSSSGEEEETKVTYYVKYNSNGGTGTMDNSTHYYNYASSLSTNKFTRENYIFVEWNTKADGSGDNYTDGETVSDLSSTNGVVVELYAQWADVGADDSGNNDEIVLGETSINLSLNKADKTSLNLIASVKGLDTDEKAYCEIYMIPDENTGYETGTSKVVATIKDCKNGKNLVTVPNLKANTKYTFQVQLVPEISSSAVGDKYVTFSTLSDDGTNNDGGNDNSTIDKSPNTGALATILVSLIGIGSAGGIFYYRKKIKK